MAGVSGTSGSLIGYARVSTDDQDLSLQLDALRQHGVIDAFIFTDKASGEKSERPGLSRCFDVLQKGDVLVVWRLDRLGRSLRDLVSMIERLETMGVAFRSLSDGVVDTTTASGRLIFNVFGALAQFERQVIAERTKAGLAAARARGRLGGRPRIEGDDPRVITAKALHRDSGNSVSYICRTLRISKTTLYRWLNV
ncbi:MAG: recombinase family protein [Planctomycetaceae bacterium]|nr:recombinase family protein [Planctomycetaceae bacterium]